MLGAKRTVGLLAGSQAILVTGTSLVVSLSALLGRSLAPDARLATVPMGFQAFAAMLTALPASLLMQRIGRRAGFLLGAIAGLLGAVLGAVAVVEASFAWFCAGSALFGVSTGIGQYYRFAAAEAVAGSRRARAISFVLAGGLVAAFAGPNLARATRDLFADATFLGSFAALAGLQLLAAALLAQLDLPAPARAERRPVDRGILQLLATPNLGLAVLGAIVAFGTMNILMAATPLAMESHGFAFDHTAAVIQWHLVGMFAPSFVSGRLTQRFGTLPMMAGGAIVLAASVVLNLSGTSLLHFLLALAGVGVGWNFLFVAASTLLTESHEPSEKAKAQGMNDLLIFGTVTLTATSAGGLHELVGWQAMNWAALPAVGLVLLLSVRGALRSPA